MTSNTGDENDQPQPDDPVLIKVKTQFLRNMAHKIDTDMIRRLARSASKFREISESTSVPDFVGTVFDAGEEYGVMLENVLKYYDSVNGTFKAVEGPMLIRNVIADARIDARQQLSRVSSVQPLININIRHDVPVSEMIGDGPVIKECLQELIYNGLRHDDSAQVTLYVTAMSHDPCHVTFTVENQGIQIKDADLASIFTPFHTIHRGIVHGCGLGVGLARCKRMAHELGGDLHVQNGKVTSFSLNLPIKHNKEIRVQSEGMDVMYGRRPSDSVQNSEVTDESLIFKPYRISATATKPSVLVVDDSAIARRQFHRMMVHVDVDVDLCEGPTKCLELVKIKTYDVICLDIIMPVMSGVTCAHHIREGSTANKTTPIVIITADSSTETRQLCACIPDSTVLEKPAKRNILFRTLMSSVRGAEQREWMRKAWRQKNSENVVE